VLQAYGRVLAPFHPLETSVVPFEIETGPFCIGGGHQHLLNKAIELVFAN
jgi:hypothetical protein